MEKIKSVVYNCNRLKNDIEYYKKMFPDTYIGFDELIGSVKKEMTGCNIVAGFSVSPEWEDKCYMFESKVNVNGTTEIEYIGIGKA